MRTDCMQNRRKACLASASFWRNWTRQNRSNLRAHFVVALWRKRKWDHRCVCLFLVNWLRHVSFHFSISRPQRSFLVRWNWYTVSSIVVKESHVSMYSIKCIGEWRYNSTHFSSRPQIEMSVQIFAPATFPPEKGSQFPIRQDVRSALCHLSDCTLNLVQCAFLL
jgi:hypothetical protein